MSANNGYTFEVGAHWIASYFRKDGFLDIPGSVGEAIIKTERHNAWLRQRYPGMHGSLSESYSGDITFFKYVSTASHNLVLTRLTRAFAAGRRRPMRCSTTWACRPCVPAATS